MSRRSRICGAHLGLLALCVGLWLASHFCIPDVIYNTSDRPGGCFTSVSVETGRLCVQCFHANMWPFPHGWMVRCSPDPGPPMGTPFTWQFQGQFLGFQREWHSDPRDCSVAIPLWWCLALLGLLLPITWRKTRGQGRGFPVRET